ncbi:tRNA (adenosine(37)-N6)-threonylcarbamoyltransferase complex dimerization subunit type 1 TsaB [Alkalibacterium olivapovliticus]|uniref:tRNA threonylcarbamoyladenosine biosynthesis protein TsaB n=1 Tax=Alkalibacterium olivapovliticus TaxID=99907 RepID=A0A2T0W9P4_9LACT|nr:tRNA (adenosine(37)-N6)-threonylcarbamoyltransferase complex dimerization subunit type 1 TsaB [Alkalibacterium olivapovliticus]PRY83403.1 tRNA threonylcarbamoyladenosine biosynthesis protein TsaB [Alkalibacterium olivapovliticus]
MKILGIDTSNQVMSVALVEDSTLLVEKTVNIKRNHSVQLMPAVEALFKEAGWQPNDLDRIAVAKGPGSYTGVRIGVTIAKTLAFSLKVELVGVSSLHVLAGNGEQIPNSYIVPLFDARRNNLYTGLYRYDENGCVPVEKDTHISADIWTDYLKSLNAPIQFIGSDVQKYADLLKTKLGSKFIILPMSRHYPRASVLADIARTKEPEAVHLFEPDYLKLAEAEQNWMEAHPDQSQGGGWIEKL